MKVRTDFVTNSSSSSFVLAFKDEKELKEFIETCEDYSYGDFYNLINSISSDYLEISNETGKVLFYRDIISKSNLLNYNWPEEIRNKIQNLYAEDLTLEPYGIYSIPINSLENDNYDISSINFKEYDDDEFSISILGSGKSKSKDDAYEMVRNFIFYEAGCSYIGSYCKNNNGVYTRDVLEPIRNLKWPEFIKAQIEELYEENRFLENYNGIKISLNDFKNNIFFDPESIGFSEINHEDFRLYIENNKYYSGISESFMKLPDVRKFVYNLLQEKICKVKDETVDEYKKRIDKYKESELFQNILKDFMCNELLNHYKQRIYESKFTVNGMIWDSNGGLLEWAIRNDFILDEFGRYCLANWNVG